MSLPSTSTGHRPGPLDNGVLVFPSTFLSIQNSMDRMVSSLKVSKPVHEVCIKINLCDYRSAESGATSDPRVVKALVLAIFRAYNDPHVSLVETDSSGTKCETLFSMLGFRKLESDLGLTLLNLRRSEWLEVPVQGSHFSKISVPKPVIESDLVVNHPKLKTHGKTKITVALKNMFGCVRDKYKAKYHPFLDEVIVDINRAIGTDNIIVDGIIGMEGWGPTYGVPKQVGLLIGGRNPVSVDSFCASLMGFSPNSIRHISLAERAGLGPIKYNLLGEFDQSNIGKYEFKFDRIRYLLRRTVEGQIS